MWILASIGTVIAGFIVGGILIATGHVFLGIILGMAAIPLALVVGVGISSRY